MLGQKIAHYRVLEQLGTGGMGVVYLARDETLDRNVALKVLRPGSLADENARKRFQQEARALAKLNHPNIAAVYEFGQADGMDYLVTEYVAGVTLADRVASGPIPEPELLAIADQIGAALQEASANGLVHLDLKPRNMMYTPKGQIKLLDFGLARFLRTNEGDATQSLTAVAVIAGTPPYMAPEQLLGGTVDDRTDIYAFGASLYELATGHLPFTGRTSTELIAAVLQISPAPPTSLSPQLSPCLEKVILKCLEKDPNRRYQTVAEMLAELKGSETTLHLDAARLPARKRPGKWLRPWTLGFASVPLLAIAIPAWWLFGSRPALPFADRDWVLVAEFENQTADPIFDQSLSTAFHVSLEQSKHANLFPRSRILDVLARMKKDRATRIDEAVGQEIAVREGIQALVVPSVSGMGESYRLAARIHDVKTDRDVETVVVKAQGKKQVLDSLDKLAAKVRGALGESHLAISRNSLPLATVTTASLDALKQYSIAVDKHADGRFDDARVYYQNALTIDPSFTAARGSLGMIEFEQFDKEKGRVLLADVIRHVDNLTDRERYGLLAFHARAVLGDFDKAIAYQKVLTGLYPDFALGHNNLGIIYQQSGRYQDAINEFKLTLKLDPQLRITFWNLAYTDIDLVGDMDAALDDCKKEIASNGPYVVPYSWMGYAELVKGRTDDAIKDLRRADEFDPRFSISRFNLAIAYLRVHQPGKAADVLNEILALQPENCEAAYYLGLADDDGGDRAAARRDWQRAAACHGKGKPTTEDFLERAIVQIRLGDAPGAKISEQKAESPGPGYDFLLARLRAVQGRTEEALTMLEGAEQNKLHDFGWVKLNPDLQSLSAQPRFVALLRRHLKGIEP